MNCVLDSIKQLQDYRIAELLGAKTSACLGVFYERNNLAQSGDFLDQGNEEEERGEFLQTLEPGVASVAPTGYSVKSVTPTHPNSGYGEFNKSILTQMASSLGVSYAKLCKDYGSVNYSSLKESIMDEQSYFAEQQQFMIENWKEIEFSLFITSIVVNGVTKLKPSQVRDVIRYHQWITQKRHYVDPAKDILAAERELKLGLKSPLMVMEEDGNDPEELMKSWAQYKTLCKKYDLAFNVTDEQKPAVEGIVQEDEDFNNDATQDEYMNTDRN